MLGSGSHEQKIAWLEWVPLPVMKENTSAAHDDVNLVLFVWGSWARERREASEREHGVQGPMPQKADRVLARGLGLLGIAAPERM